MSAPGPPAAGRIEHLNSGLMLVTALVAWLLPVELFVVAYVGLGPLHYLTQMSWLHDRGWFLRGRLEVWLLAIPAAVYSFGQELDPILRFDWRAPLIVGTALAAVALVAVPRRGWRWPVALAALGLPLLLREAPGLGLLAIMLPTIAHVFVFTAAFVLRGALVRRSGPALLSFAVMLGCAVVLLAVRPDAGGYAPAEPFASMAAPFDLIRRELGGLLGVPLDPDGLTALMRFMAFAYTYHYLNWFSKTRLIRWHAVGRGRLVALAALYACCLALYAVDYAGLGFLVVGFVGMLHVFTELPVNARTFGALAAAPVRALTRS